METLVVLFGVALLFGLYRYISDRRQAGAQSPKTDYPYLRDPRGEAVFLTNNGSFTHNSSGGHPSVGFSDGSCTGGGDMGGGGGDCGGGS
jgi:hypothetical protein